MGSTELHNGNLPLEWTALSLQYDRHKRLTTADLASVIVRVSTTPEELPFCGICCMEEGLDITDDLVDGYSEKHATEVETPK